MEKKMIIENLDSLKTWLFKTLEPICDADPSALAKYVVALVKKDKSETELKALCVDQLDVFLQKGTRNLLKHMFYSCDNKWWWCWSFCRHLRGDDRKRDDRTRKRNDYDRIPPRRDSYRDRYNRRRGRSYSRSRSRSKDRARDRERDRDRSSRSHSRSHSRSRERDAGRSKYEPDRGDRGTEVGAGEGLLPIPAATATFPVPTLSSTITVIAPQGNHSNSIASVTDSWSDFHPDQSLDRPLPPQRKRCRDYDEKGFCMRGDICPFDHGIDPVVVEDVNLPNMFQAPPPIPGVAQPPPGLPPPPGPPPLLTPPPVNLRPPVPLTGSLPPGLPPVFYLNLYHPPGPPHQASGMDAPPSSIANSVPTIVTTGTRPSIPQPPAPLFPPGQYDSDMYNPEDPSLTNTSRVLYRHRVNAQRPNLIGLTMGEDLPHRDSMPNRMRIVLDSASRKRSAVSHHGAMLPKKPWNPQNQNQKAPFGSNTKLSVLQIPQGLNNISKLNQHFSKFGTIVNLQVTYGNDPEGALIQFDSHEEAKRALQSPEAVLNNRFIRVLWHCEDEMGQQGMGQQGQQHHQPQPLMVQQPATSLKQSVKDRLGPLPADSSEPNQDSRVASQNDFKSNLSMKERLGFASKPGSTPRGPTGKVFSTSTGLTKTVYNMAALKAAQKTALFAGVAATEEAMKNKQEALRLQQEMRKKKQEILEKHIETQKLLICKLEKNKTMKTGDKAVIMTTLGTLTKSITKLQQEIKGLSNPSGVRGRPRAQKELLDTELDLYKKTQSGEDTVQLKIRYTQLQLEAAKRGILAPGRGRGAHARGRGGLRGRGRGRGCRGKGLPVHSTVDHRPRALEISGFTETDLQDLLPHFCCELIWFKLVWFLMNPVWF
uniref:RNA binding motif protein 26 n=1 Tax=Oncorhynchus tshawytscha TaxID=74940 RepID=A0AAZ3S7C2_ONCTS